MNKKITTEFLQSINACQSGIDQVDKYENKEPVAVIRQLVADNHWDWANWLLPRLMDYKGYVSYAVFAALQVIDIYEKKYPNDKRPRLAIEAAQRCIDDPSKKNKLEAAARAWSAEEAAAEEAEIKIPEAAWAAAAAARAAEEAARAAEEAAWAAAAAEAEIKAKIIEYGISLFAEK